MIKKQASTLSESIIARLRQDILEGQFAPGEKLLMSYLKTRYQTGAAPIREALCKLMATGYVIAKPQRGFEVAAASLEDFKDIYHSRIHIDNLVLGLSIEHGDEDWEANLVAAFHKLQCAKLTADRADIAKWQQRKMLVYDAMMAGCPLENLKAIFYRLVRKGERYRYLWFSCAASLDVLNEANKGICQIVQAVLERDKEKAQSLLATYLAGVIDRIEEGLTQSNLISR